MIFELCYTCRRDAELAASTDRPRNGVRRIWVVDTPDADIPRPHGVEVWVAPFPRPGNLNGWECLAGMLACYQYAFAQGATAVIKRDSDTVILNDAALVAFDESTFAIGAHQAGPGAKPWQFFGCAYGLSPKAIPILQSGLDRRDWPQSTPAEDLTFSWFMRFNSRVHPWTAIRFTKNRRDTPGPKFAENRGNLWELDSMGRFAAPPKRGAR